MGEATPRSFDRLIADYYERAPEEARLEQGPFQLEEARTRELIRRFAPPPPGTVVDVGGAAGAHALWLAEAGYSVHLLDAVPRLVAEAQRRSAALLGVARMLETEPAVLGSSAHLLAVAQRRSRIR